MWLIFILKIFLAGNVEYISDNLLPISPLQVGFLVLAIKSSFPLCSIAYVLNVIPGINA